MNNETKLNEPKLIKSQLQPGNPGEQKKPTPDDYAWRRKIVVLEDQDIPSMINNITSILDWYRLINDKESWNQRKKSVRHTHVKI